MRALLFAVLLACATLAPAQQGGNIGGTLFAAGVRSATASTADQNNPSWRGVTVILRMTTYTSGTWTPRIQAKDPVSATYYDILVGTAITTPVTTPLTVTLKVYPGTSASPAIAVSEVLPRTWRFQMTGTSTPSANFTAGVLLNQ